jgi:NAD(P)-dependent dehydrogenase (short-subunit alcohol dehydrogenase family)
LSTLSTRRVAVVTGAARGIGQAIALRLAEAGHAVALGDMRPAGETEKQITNGGGDALSVPCDLSSAAGVDELVGAVGDRYGRCDGCGCGRAGGGRG